MIVAKAKSALMWLLSTVCIFAVPMYLFGLGCFWYVLSNQGLYHNQVNAIRRDWEDVNGRLLALEQFDQDQRSQNRMFYEAIDSLKLTGSKAKKR